MKMRISKKARNLTLAVVLCILGAAAVYFGAGLNRVMVSPSYAVNISDTTELVGFSNHVFVGTVKEQIGTKTLFDMPYTFFRVETGENIKGKLNWAVTVRQMGGQKDLRRYSVEDDVMVEPGKQYLFAARLDKDSGEYEVVPVYGHVPLSDAALQRSSVSSIVEKYRTAYQNSKDFDTGVKGAVSE